MVRRAPNARGAACARSATCVRSAATRTVVVGLLLVVASSLAALEVPYLTGRVNDLAGLLDADARARLEQTLAAFEQETGSQVTVLTVSSLEGDPIEDFSIRVVDTWKLGREGVDDGALLLIAKSERRLRIEVGYGLEGALTDAQSRRILDRVITPRFRAGDFAGGIEAGVDSMLAVIRGEELPAPAPLSAVEVPCVVLLAVALLLILALILLGALLSRGTRRRSRGWSSRRGGWVVLPTGSFGGDSSRGKSWGGRGGGFSGGGFGGFSGGGGGFGGGGASGSW